MQPVVFFMVCETCGLDGAFPHEKPSSCPNCGSSQINEKKIEIPAQDPPFEMVVGTLDQRYEIAWRNYQIANAGVHLFESIRVLKPLFDQKKMRDEEHPAWPIFDLDVKAIPFSDDISQHIPNCGSIIYTIWDIENTFLYAGIAGLQKRPSQRNPLKKIESIASGKRQKESFCLLIHDRYVLPEIAVDGRLNDPSLDLDRVTQDFMQRNLFYRFASFKDEVSASVVRHYLKEVRRGAYGFPPPILNGI